jgi:uncharacterized protein (DUF362 family)
MEINRRSFLQLSGMLAYALAGNFEGLGVFLKKSKEERPPVHRENVFKEDGKSFVSVVGGKDVEAMVRESVSFLGGFKRIGVRGRTVLVKPNVVAGRKNPTTTNPAVVKAVVKILYEEGASKVYVGDMSALLRLPTKDNMEKTGIKTTAQAAGAQVVFFEDHEWIKVKVPKGKYVKEVEVSEWIFKTDRIVNLPVIKTHRSAQYSICLKNFVGATHFRQRPYFVDSKHWEEIVAEINLAYTPDLNIVDGTTTMVEGGPWKGTDVEANLIMASGDRVAADVVGLALIKSYGLWKSVASRSVWEQRQIKRAAEIGLGAGKRDGIKLVTSSIGKIPGFEELVGKIEKNLV